MKYSILIYMIALFVIGAICGVVFNNDKASLEKFQEMCPEIDELCEEDFLRMCELSVPEIDNANIHNLDNRSFKNLLRICNTLVYELNLCSPMEEELRERIEWLEDVADIYGDTWREGDCGEEISKGQKEAGMDTFDAWKKNWG